MQELLYIYYITKQQKTQIWLIQEALKKEGFSGTWKIEGVPVKGEIEDIRYNQIQLFDGSLADIIPENTKKVFRETNYENGDVTFTSRIGDK